MGLMGAEGGVHRPRMIDDRSRFPKCWQYPYQPAGRLAQQCAAYTKISVSAQVYPGTSQHVISNSIWTPYLSLWHPGVDPVIPAQASTVGREKRVRGSWEGP